MLCPLYMAEISPPEVRGSLMTLEQFSIVLGVVIGFWTGFITRSSMLYRLFLLYMDLRIFYLHLNSFGFLVMAHSARRPNHPGYHPCFGLFFPPAFSPTISSTGAVRWSSQESSLLEVKNARRSWIGSLVARTFLNCFSTLISFFHRFCRLNS